MSKDVGREQGAEQLDLQKELKEKKLERLFANYLHKVFSAAEKGDITLPEKLEPYSEQIESYIAKNTHYINETKKCITDIFNGGAKAWFRKRLAYGGIEKNRSTKIQYILSDARQKMVKKNFLRENENTDIRTETKLIQEIDSLRKEVQEVKTKIRNLITPEKLHIKKDFSNSIETQITDIIKHSHITETLGQLETKILEYMLIFLHPQICRKNKQDKGEFIDSTDIEHINKLETELNKLDQTTHKDDEGKNIKITDILQDNNRQALGIRIKKIYQEVFGLIELPRFLTRQKDIETRRTRENRREEKLTQEEIKTLETIDIKKLDMNTRDKLNYEEKTYLFTQKIGDFRDRYKTYCKEKNLPHGEELPYKEAGSIKEFFDEEGNLNPEKKVYIDPSLEPKEGWSQNHMRKIIKLWEDTKMKEANRDDTKKEVYRNKHPINEKLRKYAKDLADFKETQTGRGKIKVSYPGDTTKDEYTTENWDETTGTEIVFQDSNSRDVQKNKLEKFKLLGRDIFSYKDICSFSAEYLEKNPDPQSLAAYLEEKFADKEDFLSHIQKHFSTVNWNKIGDEEKNQGRKTFQSFITELKTKIEPELHESLKRGDTEVEFNVMLDTIADITGAATRTKNVVDMAGEQLIGEDTNTRHKPNGRPITGKHSTSSKGFQRAIEKMLMQYQGNKLMDGKRATLEYESPQEMVRAMEQTLSRCAHHTNIKKVTVVDKFGGIFQNAPLPSGYRDAKVIIEFRNGESAELQFNTSDILRVKSEGTKLPTGTLASFGLDKNDSRYDNTTIETIKEVSKELPYKVKEQLNRLNLNVEDRSDDHLPNEQVIFTLRRFLWKNIKPTQMQPRKGKIPSHEIKEYLDNRNETKENYGQKQEGINKIRDLLASNKKIIKPTDTEEQKEKTKDKFTKDFPVQKTAIKKIYNLIKADEKLMAISKSMYEETAFPSTQEYLLDYYQEHSRTGDPLENTD